MMKGTGPIASTMPSLHSSSAILEICALQAPRLLHEVGHARRLRLPVGPNFRIARRNAGPSGGPTKVYPHFPSDCWLNPEDETLGFSRHFSGLCAAIDRKSVV